MFKRVGADDWIWQPALGAAVETVDRGFDWGSAVAGAGVGAGCILLLIALAAAWRARSSGSHHRGGKYS